MHGDDYCSAAPAKSLDWLEGILKKRYEIKSQRITSRAGERGNETMHEGQVLNRVIRCTPDGYELEADLRHAELIIEQLGMKDAKPVVTPGIDTEVECLAWTDEPEGEELDRAESTRYRAIAARCNYLQPDRPDIQYAAKEVCRLMSRPTARAMDMLRRIGRYLRGKPRLVWKYGWQSEVKTVDITTDANWAGCRRARKSTSGGTIMLGDHLIRTYSKTQATIAKSSGESELYALVRASA